MKQIYRFGEFELDLDARQLRLRGVPVRLERRPMDLLILLVNRHGSLVAREDIIAALWPSRIIIDFDAGLNTLVRKVRQALGDSPDDPRYIETVPGRGYRFTAPLETPAPPAPPPEEPVVAAPSLFRRRPVALVALLVIAIGSLILAGRFTLTNDGQTRIAVLPFENLTGKDELRYLATGIAEDTSHSLSRIDLPNLSVIGVVSSQASAATALSLRQTGRELGADFLVLSSLRLEGSTIRLTSRLIRVRDSEQLWSASFDRELTNLLGLQQELSVAIAEQVRQRLSPEVAAAVSRRQTENPEAYELYLKGRYEWMQFQPGAVGRARQYYERAVIKDPEYALAWAGIAHALITSPVTAEADRNAIVPAAREALQRALDFGPDLAESQLALGSFYFFIDRDLPAAEATARKAVALDPNSAMAHMFLGVVLSQAGKHLEARAMLRRARELDPLFPLMFANSAMVSLAAGELDEARELATQAIAIGPEFWVGYLHLGGALFALGDYEGAIEAYANAEKFSGNNSSRAASARAFLLARLGRQDDARDILADLLTPPDARQVPDYYVALVYAGLGETGSAFEWLNRAIDESTLFCLDLPTDRMLEALRTDVRFDALQRRCDSGTAAAASDR